MDSIRDAMVASAKHKITQSVRSSFIFCPACLEQVLTQHCYYQDVIVKKGLNQIHVHAANEEGGAYRRLMYLRRVLPSIVVKGIHGLTRAVISEKNKGGKQLLVEGMGLREVMNIDGAFRPFVLAPSTVPIADAFLVRCRWTRDYVQPHHGGGEGAGNRGG